MSEALINFQSYGTKKQFRVIPKIEIKGENVVKGIQMEGLRVLANPEGWHYFIIEMHLTKFFLLMLWPAFTEGTR